MLMEGGLPNYFTINGKAYPSTDTIRMRVGETLKFRMIGTNNNFIHPMDMHGGPLTVVARDRVLLSEAARFQADVLNIGPGQRYDVIWPARVPGKWIFHCHIAHHTLNNNVEVERWWWTHVAGRSPPLDHQKRDLMRILVKHASALHRHVHRCGHRDENCSN